MASHVIIIFILLFETVVTIENHNNNSTVNDDITIPRNSKGIIKFHEEKRIKFQDNIIPEETNINGNKIKFCVTDNETGYGLIKNDRDQSKPIKFETTITKDTENINENFGPNIPPNNINEHPQTLNPNELQSNIKFENEITNLNIPQKKKKRRKRRKPRLQSSDPGNPGQYNGQNPNFAIPEYQGNYGLYQGYLGGLQQNPGHLQRPGVPGGLRPYRGYTQRPSEDALSTITEALTSVARYDDLQCVPRLLCEVAGGRAPVQNQGSGLLQTMVNLQPLVTLLAAYNGLSTSPLFVFGRAVILGMSSRGSTSACQSSYPLCPSDPEKLVEYLNNHNGGFFRFFNNPHLGQNQNYFNQNLGDDGYGLYQNGYGFNQNGNQLYQNGKGYPLQGNYGNQLGIYSNGPQVFPNQHYGLNPLYGLAKVNDNRIEDRIVNVKDDGKINWAIPNKNDNNFEVNKRFGKGFKFPENMYGLRFPAKNYANPNYQPYFGVNESKLKDEDEEIIYIVRGDGDPNKPEIFKVKKGKSVS